MVILLYKAETVGPVCQRLSKVGGFKVVRDSSPLSTLDKDAVIVRWGSDATGEWPKAVNSQAAVVLAKDKIASRKALGDLAPKTYYTLGELPKTDRFLVIRPKRHHGGNRLYVKRTPLGWQTIIKKLKNGWYATDLIDKAEEYRVFVLHGRVVAVSQRFPAKPTDVAWNLAAGGRLINVKYKSWPLAPVVASIEACKRTGLDWAAVDVCVDKNGKAWVFELNTAPGLRNPYTISKITSALSWTDKNGPAKPAKRTDRWQSLIHPSAKETE